MKKGIGSVVSSLAGVVAGVIAGGTAVGTILNKGSKARDEMLAKMKSFYFLENQWICNLQAGKTLVDYFKRNDYHTIAIYGMKELGERLYDELKDSDITVKYAIDKNADGLYVDLDVVMPDEDLEEVDVIVVTAISYFDEIEETLCQKVDCPVISLEDIVFEV